MNHRFQNKHALVTGATKGIGREISLRMAAEGCHVCAVARTESDLELLQRELDEEHCSIYAADLASAEESVAAAEHFLQAVERIDIVINNAGVSYPESIIALDVTSWDTTMDVNVRAPALIVKTIAPSMIDTGGGTIVNVSSQSGVAALPDHAAYCASKFALHGLTKVMALELGPHKIRVNAVAPTITMTPMGTKVWGDPLKSEPMLGRIPLGRFAEPSDVADAVLFLASEESAMITGEVLLVDGGFTIH